MTLTKIKYFMEVASTLNFTQAAEKLFIAQPNLSKHIAQMEEEIGVQLFVRTKRSVNLTEAGKMLFDELDGVPQQIENAFEQARALGRGENGRIAIGILEGQELTAALLKKLEDFEIQYPHIEIILERAGFSRLRAGLATGCYDAIITMCFDITSTQEFNYNILLSRGGGVIAINHKNPMSEKNNLSLSDLKDENFVVISPEESPQGYSRFISECSRSGFTPKITRKLNSLESLMLCVEAGLGITLLDHNTRLEKNSEVCTFGIPDSPPAYLGIVWRGNDSRPVLKNLIKTMNLQ